jgi:hypothetical protein
MSLFCKTHKRILNRCAKVFNKIVPFVDLPRALPGGTGLGADLEASERIWKPRCSATIAWEQTRGISTKDKTAKYVGLRCD